MSIWDSASENAGSGNPTPRWITPTPTRQGQGHDLSGDEAMGHEVPYHRQHATYKLLRRWGYSVSRAQEIVGRMSYHILRDEPKLAMEYATQARVDVTGVYMLMAHLLAGGPPKEPSGSAANGSSSASRLRVRGNPATGFKVV